LRPFRGLRSLFPRTRLPTWLLLPRLLIQQMHGMSRITGFVRTYSLAGPAPHVERRKRWSPSCPWGGPASSSALASDRQPCDGPRSTAAPLGSRGGEALRRSMQAEGLSRRREAANVRFDGPCRGPRRGPKLHFERRTLSADAPIVCEGARSSLAQLMRDVIGFPGPPRSPSPEEAPPSSLHRPGGGRYAMGTGGFCEGRSNPREG
jgi:hypothetical protein